MRNIILCSLLALAACGDSKNKTADAGIDNPVVDAAPDASCFTNPQNHEQILNECNDWQHVDKTPVTPLRNSDGSLPPLPQ